MRTLRLGSGGNIAFRETGAGIPVVLLHPVGLAHDFWDDVAGFLPPGLRLLAFDMPDHGDSDPPERNTIEGHSDAVGECLAALGVERALVAGCSMGGMVAQALAIRHPRLVGGMLLLNTTSSLPAPARSGVLDRAREAEESFEEHVDAVVARWFATAPKDELAETIARTRRRLLKNGHETLARGWRAIADLDLRADELPSGKPVIFVAGARDAAGFSDDWRALAEEGRARLVTLDTGHLGPLEKPRETADLLISLRETAGD